VMDVLPNTVYAREAFLPMSFCAADFATNYVPFVAVAEARKNATPNIGAIPRNGPLLVFPENG
jgi:hypothetical protein